MKESPEILRALPRPNFSGRVFAKCLTFFKPPPAIAISLLFFTIFQKLVALGGKDLDEVSLDTVHIFHQDAVAVGFKL